jgi:hypothetical protein
MTVNEQWEQLNLWADIAARILLLAHVDRDLLLPIYRSTMRETGECRRTNDELARLAGGLSAKTVERRLRHYADAGVILVSGGTTTSRKTGREIKWRLIILAHPVDLSQDETSYTTIGSEQVPDHSGRTVRDETTDHSGGSFSKTTDHSGGGLGKKNTDHSGGEDFQETLHGGLEMTDHCGRYTPYTPMAPGTDGSLSPDAEPSLEDSGASSGRPSGRPAIDNASEAFELESISMGCSLIEGDDSARGAATSSRSRSAYEIASRGE